MDFDMAECRIVEAWTRDGIDVDREVLRARCSLAIGEIKLVSGLAGVALGNRDTTISTTPLPAYDTGGNKNDSSLLHGGSP
jgi:hypothetical protein